jgi:hypothetical protein
MPGMAKKKKPEKKPVPSTYQDRHTLPRAVFHLPRPLLDLIDAEAEEADRTRTAEIVRALKGYYQARGLWPPPGTSDPPLGDQP